MSIVIDPSGKQITLTPAEMMQNLKNNIKSFNKRNIEEIYTIKPSREKLKQAIKDKEPRHVIKQHAQELYYANGMMFALEFQNLNPGIDEKNIQYISYIERIEKHISPILTESLGTTFTMDNGEKHTITIPWLSWALRKGHLANSK